MNPKISIVIPVYNIKDYIDKCLHSIIMQTFNDFEVILVDDGSNDGSEIICDKYSEEYGFIKTFHKSNSGPSDARNLGIEKANGQYITFIDGDDYVDRNYLKILYDLMIYNNASITMCDIDICYENEEKIESNINLENILKCSGRDALIKMLSGNLHGTSACAILMPIELARRFLFPSGLLHEDDYISYNYYLNSDVVVNYNCPLYYYFQRNRSIMHSGYYKGSVDELDVADFLFDKCSKIDTSLIQASTIKRFSNYYQILLENPEMKKMDLNNYRRATGVLNKMKWKMISNPYSSRKKKILALMMCIIGPSITVILNQKVIGITRAK